jgi:hypothetical protein
VESPFVIGLNSTIWKVTGSDQGSILTHSNFANFGNHQCEVHDRGGESLKSYLMTEAYVLPVPLPIALPVKVK